MGAGLPKSEEINVGDVARFALSESKVKRISRTDQNVEFLRISIENSNVLLLNTVYSLLTSRH